MDPMIIRCLLILCCIPLAYGSIRDTRKCCAVGNKFFHSHRTCVSVHDKVVPLILSGVSKTVCRRSASLCCHRTAILDSCRAGRESAMIENTCVNTEKRPGLLPYQECCDCCLLAKEMSRNGSPCNPPVSFSHLCKQTYLRCCGSVNDQQNVAVSASQVGRCKDNSICQHNCQDLGGPSVQCSCNPGYDLNPDLRTCRDIDECNEGSGVCALGERCINKEGSFECVSEQRTATPGYNTCRLGFTYIDGECIDVNECKEEVDDCDRVTEECMNMRGRYRCECKPGFKRESDGSCTDVDECVLLMDSCLTSQRCINTEGSFRCIRRFHCGTGYRHDEETDECLDIDECVIGIDECGEKYACRNTEGSFRCELKKVCQETQFLDHETNECKPLDCRLGMRPTAAGCEDVNECEENVHACTAQQRCINTIGSFRCEGRSEVCPSGQKQDPNSDTCIDLNECESNLHNCPAGQVCMNTVGGYRCTCPTGYEFNLETKVCEDENECEKFDGHVCSVNAKCENTVGSFKCHCQDGFRINRDGRQCDDIDECRDQSSGCAQICTNVPGSFMCGCNEGFTLGKDGRGCEDIDECEIWGRPGSNLCLGRCVNTPGSFRCECPQGFRLKADKRTCEDIDECQEGHCPGDDHVCVNMLGSYRCVEMKCPRNYIRDLKFKHRCNRLYSCTYGEKSCLETPLSTSYNLIGMPNKVDFTMLKDTTHLPLFTMRGPSLKDTAAEFDLKLRAVRISPWEKPATVASRDSFLVEKGKKPNSVLVSLQEPLEGPQEVRLDLEMGVKHAGVFAGKAVAHLHIYVSRYSLGKYVTYNPKGEHNDILTFNDP